jgi:hypothetical protein
MVLAQFPVPRSLISRLPRSGQILFASTDGLEYASVYSYHLRLPFIVDQTLRWL